VIIFAEVSRNAIVGQGHKVIISYSWQLHYKVGLPV